MYVSEQYITYREFMNTVYHELDYDEMFMECITFNDLNEEALWNHNSKDFVPIKINGYNMDKYIGPDKQFRSLHNAYNNITVRWWDSWDDDDVADANYHRKINKIQNMMLIHKKNIAKNRSLVGKVGDTVGKVVSGVKNKVSNIDTGDIKRTLSQGVNIITKFIRNNYKVIGAASLASLVTVAAYKIYKHYKTKDPKLAVDKAKQFVSNAKAKCSQSKDPTKCKERLRLLSKKWDAKMESVQTQT